MSNPRDYTIGWICAIATEFIAAQAFLDEKHECPEVLAQNDNNTYALGRMGKHNIAIAVLPKSSYGTTSAAVVARDMVHSFPNIRIGLMVGIGGGAPTQLHDVRLGDVVVGCPTIREGGVIHYDYGKTIQNQTFAETGHLNQPPQSLLTAVNALEAEYALEGHQIQASVENALQRRPRLRKTHSRPSPDTDRLYRSDITHPSISSGDCSEDCDSSHLVHRYERDDDEDNPAIHCGLIASANQLMKDALKRDRLASDRGVLCFEMEAAGLANHFPCLVVRGICDYSDTHKNKDWQGFAAMTAAAYAKDLLGQIVPSRIETEARVTEILKSVEENQLEQIQTLAETKDTIEDIKSIQRFDRIKAWLDPPDTSTNANHARNLRHEGTGQWIFEYNAFKEWNAGLRQHLWLHGLAGCGKTVLATTILDNLLSRADLVALPFFFDFSNRQKQTVDQMVRGLVYQHYTIMAGFAEFSATTSLEHLYELHEHGLNQPKTKDLSDCFNTMLKHSSKACILLDALDECRQRKDLLSWLASFASSSSLSHVKILVTGRQEVEFQRQIPLVVGAENCISLHLDSVNADIRSYVNAQLRMRAGFKRWISVSQALQRISEEVGDKADGMFRWAACQLDTLEDCLNLEEIETALKSLPKDLNETYDRILANIPKTRKNKSVLLLQFLVHSRRPMLLQEAVDLVAIREKDFEPQYRMPDPAELPQFCPSLVKIVDVENHWDIGRKEVHLAHFSVEEYLLSSQGTAFNLTDASISMTHACLTYLRRSSEIQYPKVSSAFPLIGQAVYWMEYARHAESSATIVQAAADFLQNEKYFRAWETAEFSINRDNDRLYGHSGCLRVTALSCACGYGLRETARALMGRGMDLETPQGGIIALQACSHSNLHDIAQILLDKAVDVNAEHPEFGCALQHAAGSGHHQMVKLLLSRGANIRTQMTNYTTPLYAACDNGHMDIAQTLLENGADPNGHEEVVRLLLQSGADPNLHSFENQSPLGQACRRGFVNIVQLLLEHHAIVDDQTGDNSPFLEASRNGHVAVVRLLLEHHATVGDQTGDGSPLVEASKNGHTAVVRLLLDYDASHEAQHSVEDVNKDSRLMCGNTLNTSKALKEAGDRYTPRDGDDSLSVASKFGHQEIVQLLLERVIPSNRPSQYWSRVLTSTIVRNQYHIIKMLVEAGVDVNTPTERHGCVLNCAVAWERLKIVQLLWEHGADINIRRPASSWNGRPAMTALELARHLKLTEIADLISQTPPSKV